MKDITDEFSFVLKPSSIQNGGIGVFATHDIKSGTKLSLNKDGGESRIINLKDLPEDLRHISIALPDGKVKVPKEFNHLWIVWYLNHSSTPNAELNIEKDNYYSIKDIKKGEEILIDYNKLNEPEEMKEVYYR